MKEPKKDILSSFIKYLKSRIQTMKEDFKSLFRKELIEEQKSYLKPVQWRKQKLKRMPKGIKESKLDLHRGEIVASLDNGETKASIAKKYGTSPVNLHYWLKRRKIKVSKKLLSQKAKI
jgi:transcriptional regulator with GAF, ATPase, and Fis domain